MKRFERRGITKRNARGVFILSKTKAIRKQSGPQNERVGERRSERRKETEEKVRTKGDAVVKTQKSNRIALLLFYPRNRKRDHRLIDRERYDEGER